jgi:hypothetical protein
MDNDTVPSSCIVPLPDKTSTINFSKMFIETEYGRKKLEKILSKIARKHSINV